MRVQSRSRRRRETGRVNAVAVPVFSAKQRNIFDHYNPTSSPAMHQRKQPANVALALIALLCLASFAALAQDEATDPPSRVARVSDVAGELFLATPERANEWAPIGLNYPVTAGDNLWVSANGRAEIDFGGGRLRLAGDTNLHVAALDDAQLGLFVASGRVILRVRSVSGDAVRIDTPHTQVDIVRPGQYRIDVDAATQRTVVSVREGEAGVRFAGGAQQAMAGQVATVMGLDGAGLAVHTGMGSDAFDAWSAAREQRYDSSRAAAYVSPEMVGVRDLDDYGTWEATPTYGPVWYPSTVAVGWAPYRYGSWTWVAPFGWTWVDSAPWGYAPFHYGRWIYAGGRWGWCPGERTTRPRWAPALVAWYGGSGWAGGSNAYGWVPLGWGEAYTPSWGRCSGRCLRQYNQPYAVAQTDRRGTSSGRYINASVPGAMTAVPAGVLSGSRPVAPNQINVGSAAASAPVLGGAPLGLAPARNAGRPTVAAPIPAGAQFQQMTRNARPAAPEATIATPVVPPAMPGAMPVRRTTGERSGNAGSTAVGAATAPVAGSAAPGTMPSVVAPRAVMPAAATPANGGTVVATPPVRAVLTPGPAPAAPVYGGVAGGRGAYTGVAPTPGPKAPLNAERAFAAPAVTPQPSAMPTRAATPVPVVAPAPQPAVVAPREVLTAPSAARSGTVPTIAPASPPAPATGQAPGLLPGR